MTHCQPQDLGFFWRYIYFYSLKLKLGKKCCLPLRTCPNSGCQNRQTKNPEIYVNFKYLLYLSFKLIDPIVKMPKECLSGFMLFLKTRTVIYMYNNDTVWSEKIHSIPFLTSPHSTHRPYQKKILIFQPKHMLWVFKRTVSMGRFF